jgi:Zn ribbon nucleic-acid-binding protein
MELMIPKDAVEFSRVYGDDEACRRAVVTARWPEGFRCPRCSHNRGWSHRTRPLIECAECGHQASALAGTLFHGAKMPLSKLFRLAYLLVAEKSGTNVCALMRQVGVSYPTALLWARKLRTALVHPRRRKLSGIVEVDDAKLGGPAESKFGRALGKDQALLLVLVEQAAPGCCGRARIEVVSSASEEALCGAVERNIESGSTVKTDGWRGFRNVDKRGYRHEATSLRRTGRTGVQELPLVHRVISLFKRFVDGLCHGSWTHRWLQPLLDEFVFRFNRRNSARRPKLFARLLESGVLGRPPTRAAFALASRTARGVA